MANDLVSSATHITEFVPNSAGGLWHGTCGQTAAMVAMGAAGGFVVTPSMIDSMTHDMVRRGWCDPNGASYMPTLMDWVKLQGYNVLYEKDYSGDQWDINVWHPLLLEHAGVNPIVLNVARGGHLVDIETGAADEAGVQYHVICIVGKQTDGYICNDGDNWQVGQRFQVYSLATIASALPCGMGIIETKVGGHMSLPAGYSDDGTILTASNGHKITLGFRDYCLNNPAWLAAAGEPIDDGIATEVVGLDPSHGPGSQQLFQFAALCWLKSDGNVRPLWVGAMAQALANQPPAPPNIMTDKDLKALAAIDALRAALA